MENEINSVGLSENILDKSSSSNLNPIKFCRKSLDDFIDHGGYGKPLKGLGIKREGKDQIILYS